MGGNSRVEVYRTCSSVHSAGGLLECGRPTRRHAAAPACVLTCAARIVVAVRVELAGIVLAAAVSSGDSRVGGVTALGPPAVSSPEIRPVRGATE